MRGETIVNARRKTSKSYTPFQDGMRGVDFASGASYQQNIVPDRGALEKIKQSDILKDITEFTSIKYVSSYKTTTGEDQVLVFGLIGSDLKLRVIEESGTVLTPGTELETTKTGTVTATSGSNTIAGVSTLFLTELVPGDFITFSPGDGIDYEIDSIANDTTLVIKVVYGGATVVGSDIKLVEFPGGIGDFVFTGTVTSRQVSTVTMIGHEIGAKKWNGSSINNVTGSGSISTARDGTRLGYIGTDGTAHFTDNTPADGYTGGTGANADGDYNVGFPLATAIIEGGTGVVIFGEEAAEAHWVQPNNASDDVSSRTKIESFSYRGRGVKNERFLASTGNSIIFMNEDGVFEMNSYSGKVDNLIIGGKIERYWNDQVDASNGFVAYDQANDRIIAQVAIDSPQNNKFIIFDRREGNPPVFVDNQFLDHAGIVGGKLIGGSSSGGKVNTLFSNYSTSEGDTSKARFITEFDGLGSMQSVKNLQSISAILQMSPEASVVMRAYFNNETAPSLEKTITANDLTTSNNETAVYGEYVFAMGARDLVQELVIRGERVKAGMRFHTIAIEIIEESSANFKIYDIILEYKAGTRIARSMSLKNNLF